MESTIFAGSTAPILVNIIKLRSGWGEICVSSCPGKREHLGHSAPAQADLEVDLIRIRDLEVKLMLSVLDDRDLDGLNAVTLPTLAKRLGMKWRHLPIRYRYPPGPAFEHAWSGIRTPVLDVLKANGRIHIHSRHGLGRAWTVVACLLMEAGMTAEEAMAEVRTVQPLARPTALQEWYVLNYDPLRF